jgi:hypothetical protein
VLPFVLIYFLSLLFALSTAVNYLFVFCLKRSVPLAFIVFILPPQAERSLSETILERSAPPTIFLVVASSEALLKRSDPKA